MKTKKKKNLLKKISELSINIYKNFIFILKFLFITFIAGIIGIIIIINNTDPNKYKDNITNSIEKFTGASVKIDGNLKWKLFSFEPAIEIEKFSIKNEPWGKSENIFSANDITATVSLKHLFKRKIALTKLVVNDPKIYLEVSPKGIKNWRLTEEKKDKIKKNKEESNTNNKESNFELNIKSIHITNAEVFYNNRKTNNTDNIKISNILISSQNYNSPILFNIETIYKNTSLSGNFKTGSIKEFINDSNKIPLTGIIDLNKIKAEFSGIIDIEKNSPSISSTISITANDLKDSLKGIIDLPKFAPIEGNIEIITTQTFLSLKKINIKYLTANLTGSAEINFQKNKKPNIKANLHIPFFDIPNLFYPNWEKDYFQRIATGEEKKSTPSKHIKDPKAFRNIPLPVSELNLLDGNISLSIDKLKAMPEMEITDIKLNAKLNNGQGIIYPFSCKYMGGIVLLNGIASNKNNTFNGEISLKTEDVNIGKIIDSTGYKKIFTGGNTNIDAVLKGHGPNLAIFMKNLNGYIKAYTTNKMIGYNINGIFMTNDLISSIFKFISKDIIGTITRQGKQKEQSEIQCIVLNLNIENGKTTSKQGIAMQTDSANIVIDGLANIGDEYLDVSIITIIKEGFRVSNNLAEMIKIQGSFAEPNIIINKDGVINNVAKTAFTTALLGTLTGGLTLVTTGLGIITKSWINNISSDKHPCLTAFEGKATGSPEDFHNQIIIKEKLQNDIEKQKQKLDSITTSKIESEKTKIKSEK